MPAPSLAAPAAPPAVSPGLAVVVLALLLSIQPVTTDLYLPALPALTRSLGAPVAQAQLTLSALLLAFGVSQLAWGPLSDRLGRRPVLLLGLGLYTLASIGSALAPSMDWLVVWRTLQGAAMGAVVVCARAILRDLYTPLAGARAMSRALTGLGIVACLSPPTGALLSSWLGWRAALLALTVFSMATLALVALRLPETLAQSPDLDIQVVGRHTNARPYRVMKVLLGHHVSALFEQGPEQIEGPATEANFSSVQQQATRFRQHLTAPRTRCRAASEEA